MIEKMTPNVIHIVLAGAAALAVYFPTPQDAKEAFYDTIRSERAIQIEATEDRVVLTHPDTNVTSVVSFDPAAECLHSDPGMPIQALTNCIDQLYDQSESGGRLPAPIVNPTSLRPHTELRDMDEARRLALSKFCRALWTANSGQDDAIQSPGCAAVVQGVERPG